MKSFTIITISFLLFSCNQKNNQVIKMRASLDSMQKLLLSAYKPGLGEFMLDIQLHHAKLWFAGQNQNWPLADFEVHEIMESLDDIEEYCKERTETKSIVMIKPPLDSVNKAIEQKDLAHFKNSFMLLTITCNECHKATDHGFNVVIVPTSLPVVNQDFKPTR